MKTNFCSLIFLLIMSLFSCKSNSQSFKREVYDGIKLGMSQNQAASDYNQKLANNIYNSKMTDYGKLVYEEHTLQNGKKYFSVLQLLAPENDTLITGINLIFANECSEQLLYAFDMLSKYHKEFLMIDDMPKGIDESEINKDLLSKLTKRYGDYDNKDSYTNTKDEVIESYLWANRKDVDITLQRITKTSTGKTRTIDADYDFEHKYSIVLNYMYTEEMLKRINIKQSKF